MNQLCIFDMDETLLSTDKSITEQNIAAIRKLRELDIGVSIATGRGPCLIGKYIDILSLKLPIIACNGGLLVTPDHYDIIWENPIEKELLSIVLRYVISENADYIAHTNEAVYVSPGNTHVDHFTEYNKSAPEHRKAILRLTSGISLDEPLPDIIKVLIFEPAQKQTDYLKGIPGLEVLSSMTNVLDIMQEGSTKGNAVVSLAKYLNIPLNNVVVFGDNENDVSMFSCGAVGIAMGNSSDAVKSHAKFVTQTNDESGVAYAINNYVLPYFGFVSEYDDR